MKEKNSKDPNWLTYDEKTSVATVRFHRPVEMNGIKLDKLTLREPMVSDLRLAKKQAPDDDEQREWIVFSHLSNGAAAPGDFENMTLKNYRRVQTAYFRHLADDDGDDAGNTAQPGAAVAEDGDAAARD
jgi:hypothetical protein